MELIITEKPNASKRVAEALGKPVKKDVKGIPYYVVKHDGKDILIGCAVGHLYGLAEKKKTKGFAYPVFDIEWVPTYEISKGSAFTKKYLEALKKLAKDADSVTIATDYDVEGEVIGLNVMRYACGMKDARRMKFSTLTKEDLVEAYNKASPHLDWAQAEAGETRHFLDYYYGINLSRALTHAIKSAGMFKILSTGRVQGPALKILVDREREIRAFKPDPFWMVELEAKADAPFVAWHEGDKFFDKKDADKVMDKTQGAKTAVIKECKKEQFKQAPPNPFDLTTLQTEAYRCFGLKPKVTLEIAQELYTSGVISYPRTSSQELPEALGFKKILKALMTQQDFKELADMLLQRDKLVPNNGKKTDPAHPAIYPTGNAPEGIEGRQQKVYDLIVKRFLATFGDPAVRETVTAKLDVNGEIFVAKGTRTIAANWHVYYAPYVKLSEEELPKLEEGKSVAVKKITLHADETKPPKRYTPASLIRELEKRNLGTKATRAEIVETLTVRNYVKGEAMTVTDLGEEICVILEKYSPKILDEELTKHFEEDMEFIREGKKHREEILEEAKHLLTDLLKDFKSKEESVGKELMKTFKETKAAMTTVGQCMTCKKGNLIVRTGKFGRFIACERYPDCNTTFKLPATGLVEVIPTMCQHCQYPMVRMIRKAKRPQEVCINLNCPSKAVPETAERPCNKCKEGTMIVRRSIYGAFLACNKFPKCRNIARIVQNKEGDEVKKETPASAASEPVQKVKKVAKPRKVSKKVKK